VRVRRGKNYISSEFRVVTVPRVERLQAKGLFRVHSRRRHYNILFSPNTYEYGVPGTYSVHGTKPLGFDRLGYRHTDAQCCCSTTNSMSADVHYSTVHYAPGAKRKKSTHKKAKPVFCIRRMLLTYTRSSLHVATRFIL